MPEQEFEIYLSLLSKLLRLSPDQKAAISDEFRDHLEERLQVLAQSGIPREQAIQKALDEFGDVTGLALDLTKASRTPFRTVAARSTVAAGVVAAIVVCWLSFFAPEHRLVAPPVIHAQQPPANVEKGDHQPAGETQPKLVAFDDEELFPVFLLKRTDVHFQQIPLVDVCHFLEETQNVPVVIHRLALVEGNVDPSSPVNLDLEGLSFEEILNLVTRQLGLVWQVDSGLIQITTPERAREYTRQFDLHDLARQGHTLKSLLVILQMATDGWEDAGGDEGDGGTAIAVGDTLVVRQKFQQQRRIAQVLAIIKEPPLSTQLVGECTGRERLLQELKKPCDVDLKDVPLIDAIHHFADVRHVPIIINERALVEGSVALDAPVSLSLKNRPLGKLLDLLLDDLQLTYHVRDGVIQITTQTEAQDDMVLMAYNVSDLMASEDTVAQLLMAVLRTTTGTWEDIGGVGGKLARTDVGGILFVKQTDKVQDQIHSLIGRLIDTWKGRVANAEQVASPLESERMMRTYIMDSDAAAGLVKTLPALIGEKEWNLVDGEALAILVVPSGMNGAMLNGTASTMSNLIIRQTPKIHLQIQRLLRSLSIPFQMRIVDPSKSGGDGLFGGSIGGMMGGGMGGGFGGGMGGTGRIP